MKGVYRDIFRALHEGKWLYIEYQNREEKITKYWIGIKDINLMQKTLIVDGINISSGQKKELNVKYENILVSSILEGTYASVNEELLQNITDNPHLYAELFDNVANHRILNYLAECNKLDSTPYKCEYKLISYLDQEKIAQGFYTLTDLQYTQIIDYFKYNQSKDEKKIKQLALNCLSIHTDKGLYVLAYQNMFVDLGNRCLKLEDSIVLCKEFTISGVKRSINAFLDPVDYWMLEDFKINQEKIKDAILEYNKRLKGLDDRPYLVAIGNDILIDLDYEYKMIVEHYFSEETTVPIKAFFGDLVKKPVSRKSVNFALLNQKVNLDQLLAINNALKSPLTYVQGPPGTGKTNTIINTLTTAFFNDKTVLFSSYNNHPINGVLKGLQSVKYNGKNILFPVFRHGNNEVLKVSLNELLNNYESVKNINIFENTLNKNKENEIEKANKLKSLLKDYERILDLKERKETIDTILDSNCHMNLNIELSVNQLPKIQQELDKLGDIDIQDALKLIDTDRDDFLKYLYYTSIKYYKRLKEPKYDNLREILVIGDEDEKVQSFNRYLSVPQNLNDFIELFPIIITTCLSASKLATPQQYFDLAIIDEASQCNTAVSLVVVMRAKSLMLVGDPQQLQPVVLLEDNVNEKLKKKYQVLDEYDYIKNSIYKTFLSVDSISDEILLSYHYRCHPKIIEFSNQKYYNRKLNIKSTVVSEQPLQLIDVKSQSYDDKNSSYGEAQRIMEYISEHKGNEIGIITPFVKQKELINSCLKENNIQNVSCGTVHAFQGDEKDTILFSLGLTNRTHVKTYDWLKNNKELINVATSRAKKELIIITDLGILNRLHHTLNDDDLYELVDYVKSNGTTLVTEKTTASRALGIKPYSSETETVFLETLNHAMDNIFDGKRKYSIEKEVAIAHVFKENLASVGLFYTGRFDFVVYEKSGKEKFPVLAIELDGKEHVEKEIVKKRDTKKQEICKAHNLQLIRIDNSYARRYQYIKHILIDYFEKH